MSPIAHTAGVLRRLVRDERGLEVPSLILLTAFVVIPLVIALTHFSQDILDMLRDHVSLLQPGR